jgi:uncharacterized membrane protein
VTERRFPPISQLGVSSMILTIVSTIWLAAYIPKHPPLGPSIAMMAGAGVLLLANVIALALIKEFAWQTFWTVAGWTLLAYAIIAGMLLYTFLYDEVRGGVLVLMTLSLVAFAVNVPILLGFGVARYQPPD